MNNRILMQMQEGAMHHENRSAWGLFVLFLHFKCIIICLEISLTAVSPHHSL